MSIGTRSSGQIPITRFHDSEGRPTCCLLWGSKADTCPLLTTRKSGLQEVCQWTGADIERRERDGQPIGLLIPVEGCPVHPGYREEAPWLDIRTAPVGEWVLCRNRNRREFRAIRGQAGTWLDQAGLIRDPVEWCRAPD